MARGRGSDAVQRLQITGMVELPGNAHAVRQVEVPHPQDVDAVHRSDVLDRLQAGHRLDLGDQHVVPVRPGEHGSLETFDVPTAGLDLHT
jgi:hypothetical protein